MEVPEKVQGVEKPVLSNNDDVKTDVHKITVEKENGRRSLLYNLG